MSITPHLYPQPSHDLIGDDIMAELRPIPKDFEDQKTHWHKRSDLWIKIHYILGIASIFSSVLVASEILSSIGKILVSSLAAVTAALITFLKPSEKAKVYHQA